MKNLYLTVSVILVIIAITFYVENLSRGTSVYFLGETKRLSTFFPILLFIFAGLGMFITLYVIAHNKEKDLKDTHTFDL